MQTVVQPSHEAVEVAHKTSEKNKFGDETIEVDSITTRDGDTVRKLQPRHVALIGIGGTIGTALFVAIGSALTAGGPASLLIAFIIWSSVIWGVNNAMSEMVTWLPINSGFIRLAGRFVDEALGVAAGWNFFVCEAALVAFEVTACCVIVRFWDVDGSIHKAVWIAIILALYSLLNLITVEYYGESEFWFAIGKVLLITALICMTFVLMVGGNPKGDAFGFRYWKNPGAFAEYIEKGSMGRFLGFFQCLVTASFVIAGPDYLSMAAGEAINPRKTMPEAYRVVFARLVAFFVLGSLAVGIIVPYNDPSLLKAIGDGKPGAAKSPYVIALTRLEVPVLPHIINAAVLLSAFSAGNSYVFCASRTLYGLSLEGKAPRIFTKCSKRGVPYNSVIMVLAIGLLAFLSVSKNANIVLTWFVSIVTSSQLINFAIMTFTYLRFYKAMEVQGISRSELPYRSRFNPYTAYYSLTAITLMIFLQGYSVFIKGQWDVSNFLFAYFMVGVTPAIYLVWKLVKRTKWLALRDVDLFTGKKEIDEDELMWKELEAAGKLHQGKARKGWSQIRKFLF
uniref:Amino acid permease/ SLC12A domain-containing protein n=1 Tax=Protomyces lactucae-debilis TaxID=2754530 RepID=A0A1Y2FKG5_PROLT|nr:amino acid permease/ SLC12A domain-containing protein [Protomyces lactucae-debilis]ORY84472.1 amino acid permease/ SLC12A domain-containing protein [Protomyces lactucae-debilis]